MQGGLPVIECIKRAKRYGIHIQDAKSPFSDSRIITGTVNHPDYYSASRALTYQEIMDATYDVVSDTINTIIDVILEDMFNDMKFLKIELRSTDSQKMSALNTLLIQLSDMQVEVNRNAGKLGECGISTDQASGITTVTLEWIELKDIAG
jgi:hypothetical protein